MKLCAVLLGGYHLLFSSAVAFVPMSPETTSTPTTSIRGLTIDLFSKTRHHYYGLRTVSIDKHVCSSSSTPLPMMARNQTTIPPPNSSTSLTDVENSFQSTAVGKTHEQPRPLSDALSWFESVVWRSVILFLCALWASNFVVAKLVMAEPEVDFSLYALCRFAVAAVALAPFAVTSWKKANMDGATLKQALVCGSWVAFGYLGQTLGLLTTTASKSCVICSMHCVFVATIAEYWRVQKASRVSEDNHSVHGNDTKFDATKLLPAAIAVAGVSIVELNGAGGAPAVGDALSFAQPIGFGMGYLILEDLMAKKPEAAFPVSGIKLVVVATACFLMFEIAPMLKGSNDFAFSIPDFTPVLSSPVALGGVLYTGMVTTAFALWVESIAFAKVPATDASLILTTEPLFAAGCGAIALGETFGVADYVGASLIVGACALSIFMDDPRGSVNS